MLGADVEGFRPSCKGSMVSRLGALRRWRSVRYKPHSGLDRPCTRTHSVRTTIADFQTVQFMLADMSANTSIARTLVHFRHLAPRPGAAAHQGDLPRKV